jgi:hypothetical protein
MTTASSSSARRAIERLRGSDRLRLDRLHVHIGLQMLDSHGQARPTHLPGRRRRHGDSLEVSFYGQRFEATVVDGVGGDGPVDLVGRHCESGDVLSAGVALREPRVGDVVAVPATPSRRGTPRGASMPSPARRTCMASPTHSVSSPSRT